MNKYLRHTALLLLMSLVSACGTSKFFSVVESGNFQEVNRLLVAGADVNSRNDRNATPLFSAALSGSIEVAELLIKHGADINATDRAGFTPLHAASYQNRIAMAELLISNGANVNAKGKAGWTPLHKAIERYADPKMASRHISPTENEISTMMGIVNLLIAKGAEVNVAASSGDTPLIFAAASGQKNLVELLISHGAVINGKGEDGVNALYIATKMDRIEVAKLLIAHGAEIDVRTKSGYTPLGYAAHGGNRELAELLIANGADVNAKDNNGRTPLVWALLTAVLASPTGQSLLFAQLSAAERGAIQSDIKRMKGQWREVAKLLIEHQADTTSADSKGYAPLYLAACLGDYRLVESLIDHGAALDDAKAGETPLHAAIAEQHGEVVALLIRKGANVNVKNMSERTPLHFLASFQDDPSLAELMINNGADINAKDKDGQSPLNYATRKGNKNVAEVLRVGGAK